MDNKELKYKKGIEEFIFVAKSSTDIICDVVSNDLPFNEYNKEKIEVRLRNVVEMFFKNNRKYYPDDNMFEGEIVFDAEMMSDLVTHEFTYDGVTYKEDLPDLDEATTNKFRMAHEQYLKEKYHTDRFEYMKVGTNVMELFQDEQFFKKIYTEINGESKKRNKDLDSIKISTLKNYAYQLEEIVSRLESLSDKMNVMSAFEVKRWKECVQNYSCNLLMLLSKVGSPDFNTIDGVFILKNLLDAIDINTSMDDKDKFIASVIGCPISTVTTSRTKFNEWGRKADEARLSKLKTIQNLCESSLNPESNNDGNPVVKKFLSYIGKAVRDAEGASKKKK